MNFFSTSVQKTSRLFIPLLLAVILTITPISPQGEIQKAAALDAVTVIGGTGTVQQTLSAASSAITAGIQEAFFIKEFTLDGIFHGIAKMVLKSMTQSILTWINSGFQGKPAFVTDLQELITSRVDETIGEFIYNDPSLNFLCSPFQLDVKIALALSYQKSKGFTEAQCTLSDVTDNLEGFLSGTFSEGGWPAWFELTQNPVNTPTGAYLAAEAEMYARIVDEQGNTIKELDWGQGFLSFKVCNDVAVADSSQKDCDITTPGSVISNQINKSLGAGQDSLISADEIDEIIGALFAQLAQKALTGVSGLLGLGASSYSNNSYGSSNDGSFLDALGEEGITPEGQSVRNNPFPTAITNEEDAISLHRQIIDLVDSAENALETAQEQYPTCFSTSLSQSLITNRTEAYLSIASSTRNITALTELNTEFLSAAEPAEQLPPIQDYQAIQATGELNSIIENKQLELYIRYDLSEDIDALRNSIDGELNRCDRLINR